mmetsp:Transcript_18395/g.47119  ORF Transcript_18395/g.47119 Transcript_18395/m.47119 type:complete len:313 (-) Transcript_18395:280-1218(-)
MIEEAFRRGDSTIGLPTCFNAVLHFNRGSGPNDHHHQLTPAVGSKPPGFRSVLRGAPGQKVTLYWDDDGMTRLWRLEIPAVPTPYTQEIEVSAPPDMSGVSDYTWQWCDLVGSDIAHAVEFNWHAYASEHGDEIERAWSQQTPLELTIGLTQYSISQWQGIYGTQRNLTTGCVRQVRRGRYSIEATVPEAYRDDSCALCTELFTDTPQWPIRRTPCNHAFHYTCLQHILRQGGRANRCPMCRTSLAGMSLRGDSSSSTTTNGGGSRPQMLHGWGDADGMQLVHERNYRAPDADADDDPSLAHSQLEYMRRFS